MIIFPSIKDFIAYAPTCIICGKDMQLFIAGNVAESYLRYDRPGSSTNSLYSKHRSYNYILMSAENNILSPKKNTLGFGKYDFSIDINKNTILHGATLINHLLENSITLFKKCRTCDFRVISKWDRPTVDMSHPDIPAVPKYYNFPYTMLDYESLTFSSRQYKKLMVDKYYDNHNWQSSFTRIWLDSKPITFNDTGLIDLTKIKDLKTLKSKIITILAFQ